MKRKKHREKYKSVKEEQYIKESTDFIHSNRITIKDIESLSETYHTHMNLFRQKTLYKILLNLYE